MNYSFNIFSCLFLCCHWWHFLIWLMRQDKRKGYRTYCIGHNRYWRYCIHVPENRAVINLINKKKPSQPEGLFNLYNQIKSLKLFSFNRQFIAGYGFLNFSFQFFHQFGVIQ